MDFEDELQKQKDAIYYLYYNDILTEKEAFESLKLWKEKYKYHINRKENLVLLLKKHLKEGEENV